MDFNEYQKKCTRTWRGDGSDRWQLVNCALGLGESGEIQNIIKKHIFQGHDLDEDKLKEEMGDLLFYLAMMAEIIDVRLSEVARCNEEKLRIRYPNGFSEEDSINRDNR